MSDYESQQATRRRVHFLSGLSDVERQVLEEIKADAVAQAVKERDEAQARYQRVIVHHSVDCISQGCARQTWELKQHEIDEEQAEEMARLRAALEEWDANTNWAFTRLSPSAQVTKQRVRALLDEALRAGEATR